MIVWPICGGRNILYRLRNYTGLRPYYESNSIVSKTICNDRKMPKTEEELLDIQTLKKFKKAKSANLTSSRISVQTLGSGAFGAPASLYVYTDHSKYIINCGEGTQRIAQEHKVKITMLDHIFITSASWKNIGGLIGMLLTIQESGVPELTVHGPEGIADILPMMDGFATISHMKINIAQCKENESYTDRNLTMWYIPVNKPLPQRSVAESNSYKQLRNENGKRQQTEEEHHRKVQRTDTMVKERRQASVMCYACKIHEKIGSLSLVKCVELGIPTGPLFGKLKNGESITLPSGRIVHTSDVVSSPEPGGTFVAVECPTADFIDSLVNTKAFEKYQPGTSDSKDDVAICVYHFTPPEVMDDPRYRKWMEKFGPATLHIVLNESNNCMGSEAVFKNQYLLHLLHPEIFPMLDETTTYDDTEKKDENTENNQDDVRASGQLQVRNTRTLHSVAYRPIQSYDATRNVRIDAVTYMHDVFEIRGFKEGLEALKSDIERMTKTLPSNAEYPKIVMFGTGSSMPSKTRNASCAMIQVDKEHNILLDCGEGTFGQIIKLYGRTRGIEVLKNIKGIYVSHLHADHHIGLLGVLQARGRYTSEPVFLMAPPQVISWLQTYDSKFESTLEQIILVSNCDLMRFKRAISSKLDNYMNNKLNVRKVTTAFVLHCAYSTGIAIELMDGQIIVYSGDAMPSDNLVHIADRCDLLIHEATVEDSMEKEAAQKRHSTTSQAIQIGRRMKAKFILLTHFSQRYCKIPRVPETIDSDEYANVGIAYDFMSVSLSKLPLLPLFYPSLKLMFSEHFELIKERAVKRARSKLVQ